MTTVQSNVSWGNSSEQTIYSTLSDNTTDRLIITESNNGTRKDPLITLTVPATMFACGVIGNLIAIFVLLRSSREHKQTVFYRLVGALATTDLFGTCATSPVTLAAYANKLQWVGGQPLCNYESFMFVFVSCTTIFIIGSMAMDRVFAIACPFFYERYITYKRAKFYIVGLWGVAAFMGCLPLLGLGEVVIQYPRTWCFFTFTSSKLKNKIFAYGYASIGLFVVGLTGIANIIVTSILLRMRRTFSKTMSVINRKRSDCELQMMVLMLGVIVVFATCWCPFLIRILINQKNESQVDKGADLHALRLASLNQILDPWVYILFRKEFFKKIYTFVKEKLLGRCKCFLFISTQTNRTPHHNNNGADKENERARAHAHAHALDSEYVPLNTGNNKNCDFQIENENRTLDQKYDIAKTDNKSDKSSQSRSNEDTSLLRPADLNTLKLDLKHSACLFCLSNHPKKITVTNIAKTTRHRSLGKLDIQVSDLVKKHLDVNVNIQEPTVLTLNTGKRESLHLSLNDLRLF